MKKDDIWVFSLAALFIIAVATSWGILIRIAVILNALIVLFNIARKLYKSYFRKGKKC
jgi:hypothetical protein